MTHPILAIVIGAALFALYGLVPHRSCTGHCDGCTGGSCDRWNEGYDHVV